MPQLGETVVEGTITKWLKKEGDSVERDEPLFEISTDKVDTEVPSPLAGTLAQIKVQEGETVGVGTELAMIDTGGDGQAAPAKAEAAPPPSAETEPEEAEQAEEATEEQEQGEPKPAEEQPIPAPPRPREQERPESPEQRSAAPARAEAAAPQAEGPRSRILSPLVRRLAEEHQIDLGRVQGTG